ncbi:FadR/GntR family transcriptional regulator [Embleya scabrispora]|uniref:FadR/GntR family transcriptional regulator n=1 Tax=Embleya scabrispora TaxID=159449 RepID=UPI000369AD85|nr:FadR/GntR family transcriptional regulator [Embleya scabrispora]MYS80705.1 FCD domain-containing protein [Streptomyces sp. SID5474]
MNDGPDWRPVKRVRAFEEVVAQIEEQISTGRLRAGDKLPGERALAAALGVSRPSVREAMRVLEAMGVLVANTGSGPEAGAILAGSAGPALTGVLGLHLGLANFAVDDVVETRLLIESWAVEAAARHASEADLDRLRAIVAAMDAPDVSAEQFNEQDTEFHTAIAELSGNALVATFMRALRDTVRRHQQRAVVELGSNTEALRADHRAILAAIEARDPHAAAEAVAAHLRRAYPRVGRGR